MGSHCERAGVHTNSDTRYTYEGSTAACLAKTTPTIKLTPPRAGCRLALAPIGISNTTIFPANVARREQTTVSACFESRLVCAVNAMLG